MADSNNLLEDLEEKYINGEISKEEYERLKTKLKKQNSKDPSGKDNYDDQKIRRAFDGSTPQTLEPGFKLEDYEIVRLIGKGGMGKVYETIYHGLDKEVKRAIKTVPPILTRDKRALKNLKREVRIAQQLQHSNIVGTYSLEQWQDNYFIVTEYIPGQNFRDYLDNKNSTFTVDEVVTLFSKLADALDYAHSKKPPVIHRDLKPTNILYDRRDDQLKLTDFGLAREIINSISMSRASNTTYSAGSPTYMPYEQFYGEEPAPTMDQYSLGIIIYEALSGNPPFVKGNLMMQHKEKDPPVIESIPEVAMQALNQALAKDPEDRFDTVKSFINKLKPEFATNACPICGKENPENTYNCEKCGKTKVCVEHKEEEGQKLCPTCYHREKEKEAEKAEKEKKRSETARKEFDSAMEFFDSLAEESPECPICGQSQEVERFTCSECEKENICITHKKEGNLCPDCFEEKDTRKPFETFQENEILENYVQQDKNLEGEEWKNFYEQYNQEYKLPDIETLASAAIEIKTSLLLEQGNQLLNNQKYEQALEKYENILEIAPKNKAAQNKKEAAQQFIAEKESEKEVEEREEPEEVSEEPSEADLETEEDKEVQGEQEESEEISEEDRQEQQKEVEEKEKQAYPDCPICGETGGIERFTCQECGKENICITHRRKDNLCFACAEDLLISFQQFRGENILKDYISEGKKLEGEEWENFYNHYTQEYDLPDIETLKSLGMELKISQYMEKGNQLLNNKKYKDALTEFEQVLELQPDNKEAQQKLEATQQFISEQKKEEKKSDKTEPIEKETEETIEEKEEAKEELETKEKEEITESETKSKSKPDETKDKEEVEEKTDQPEETTQEKQSGKEEAEEDRECPICGDTRDINRFTCKECGRENICVFHEKEDGLCPDCFSEQVESKHEEEEEKETEKSNLSYVIIGVVLVLITGGYFLFFGGSEEQNKSGTEKVNQLLSTAQTQIRNNDLVKPSDSNAYKTYQTILSIDSGNTEAIQGLKEIANHFEQVGDNQQSNGNLKKAISNYKIALEVGLEDSAIEQKIQSVQEKLRAQQNLATLLSEAESNLNSGNLAEAYATYQEILNRESNNTEARNGIEEIANRYENRGDQQRDNENWSEAVSLYQQAIEIGGTSSAINSKIENCRKNKKLSKIPDYMVRVEGGTFQMGTNSQGENNSAHSVTVSTFYISKYEVTQQKWVNIMDSNPSYSKNAENHNSRPVEKISWYDAVKYCNKLSKQDGLTPVYEIEGDIVSYNPNAFGYRLPTEAEWEFAARNRGDDIRWSGTNNQNELTEYAWYYANSDSRTHRVGQKSPNNLGLYDMSGNVWEWCYDWYSAYPNQSQTNPKGPSSGNKKVLRGGSWVDSQFYCRVYYRNQKTPSSTSNNYGLRIVISY